MKFTGNHGTSRYRYGTFLDEKLFRDEHIRYHISVFLKNTYSRSTKYQEGRPGERVQSTVGRYR
jgi:hypothetical protein